MCKIKMLSVMMLMTLVFAGFVWAGGGEGQPPGTGEEIVGPEIWGVIVVDCSNDRMFLRVKKIDNCVVDTQAEINLTTGVLAGCLFQSNNPINEAGLMFVRYPGLSLFGSDAATNTPIITKVKNFEVEGGNRFSFDAQVQFVRPTP